MSRFLQLHLLTSYPPANLNRDDLGRPKTAIMGGAMRLRVSSQSLKRAWRSSELFKSSLDGHVGTRTKRIGLNWIKPLLEEKGIRDPATIALWSQDFQKVFGEPEDLPTDKEIEGDTQSTQHLLNKQLVHVAPVEELALKNLIGELAAFLNSERIEHNPVLIEIAELQEKKAKSKKEEQKKISDKIAKKLEALILKKTHTAADIALFGRMLASSPAYNVEAAAQVAHAISVHKVQVEDDFFTAVDDLNKGEEDRGAGHMGETEFGAGVFYLYVCINRELLLENLQNDVELANKTLAALLECAATIAPTGKQNSFASRAYASYILAEKGDQQPRSLAVAFLKPVEEPDMLGAAIQRLEEKRDNMDKVYGSCATARKTMNAETGEGSLKGLIEFAMAE